MSDTDPPGGPATPPIETPVATPAPVPRESHTLSRIILLIVLLTLAAGGYLFWKGQKDTIMNQLKNITIPTPIVNVPAANMFPTQPNATFSQTIIGPIILARNETRRTDVTALANSLFQYSLSNGGVLPVEITTTAKNIAKNGADVCKYIVPEYLPALPHDQKLSLTQILSKQSIDNCESEYDTGYSVVKDEKNHITVMAPLTEEAKIVSITK